MRVAELSGAVRKAERCVPAMRVAELSVVAAEPSESVPIREMRAAELRNDRCYTERCLTSSRAMPLLSRAMLAAEPSNVCC